MQGEPQLSYLITGGTGSMGQKLAAHLRDKPDTERIVIYSRDEQKQLQMANEFGEHGKMRYFLGDIRDKARLKRAMQGIDIVVHTAALKVVPKLEYDPTEAVETNINGTRNIIEACIDSNVKRAVLLSTDKAVMPVNLYGCTKAVAEKLWLSACFYEPIFSVARYGNIMGSRGSVLELYRGITGDKLPLTHPDMTRFWTTFRQAIYIIETAIEGDPQCVYIPMSNSFAMIELIKALGKRPAMIDMRPGEKIHETLIHERELPRAYIIEFDYFKILPEIPFDNEYEFETGEPQLRALVSSETTIRKESIRGLL